MRKRAIILILILTLALSAFAFIACNDDAKGNEPPTESTPVRGFIKADGTKVLDGFGTPIGLVGTNIGGWLVQESYLVPTDIGRAYGQIEMMLSLANRFDTNGTDGKAKMESLLAVYEDNWITEQDFANIKELGMNCVRIPFTYMNLYDAIEYDAETGEYVRVPFADLQLKSNAFARLDWAVQMCEKYEMYAILDLHGAVGSQSGNDHTGDIEYPSFGQFWLNNDIGEACRQKTKDMWVEIATRYKDNVWVGVYDLMNEPGIKNSDGAQSTNKTTWDYFDELYDAIRAVDANHMISVESCWEAGNLPPLDEYGWTNVLYQYHHYNWASADMFGNEFFYKLKVTGLNNENRNYPVLIGEFNVWGDNHPDKKRTVGDKTQTDEIAWDGVIQLYTGMGWNFTTWNYKHAATFSSWGLYNLDEGFSEQANYLTMTYDEIAEIWGEHSATNYHENTNITSIIKKYIDEFNTDGIYSGSKSGFYILNYMD